MKLGNSSTLCEYPFVSPPSCSRAYADVLGGRYVAWQIFFGVVGILSTAACVYQFFRVYRHGSSLQKGVYPLFFISSLTFVFRCIDPQSYAGRLPILLSNLAAALSRASLYSVVFAICIIWARLLKNFGDNSKFTGFGSQLYNAFMIVLCWGGVIYFAILASNPEESTFHAKQYLIIYVDLMIPTISGAVYVTYVGRILNSRVKETMPLDMEPNPAAKQSKTNCGRFLCPIIAKQTRIVRIIILFIGLSVAIVISQVLQMIYLASKQNDESENTWRVYSDCLATSARPQDCPAGFADGLFPVLELLVLLAMYWIFWKIRPNQDGDSIKHASGSQSVKTSSSSSRLASLDLSSARSSSTRPFSSVLSPDGQTPSNSSVSASSYRSSRANQNWDEYIEEEQEEDKPRVNRQISQKKAAPGTNFSQIKVLP